MRLHAETTVQNLYCLVIVFMISCNCKLSLILSFAKSLNKPSKHSIQFKVSGRLSVKLPTEDGILSTLCQERNKFIVVLIKNFKNKIGAGWIYEQIDRYIMDI